jgi:hypothetical protein
MPAKGTRGGRSDAQIQYLAEARSKNPGLSSMTSDAAAAEKLQRVESLLEAAKVQRAIAGFRG